MHLPCVYDTRPSDVILNAKRPVDILLFRAPILHALSPKIVQTVFSIIYCRSLLAMGLSLVTVLDRKTAYFQSPVNKPALTVHVIVGASPFTLAIAE